MMQRGVMAVAAAFVCALSSPARAGGDVNALLGIHFPSQDAKDHGYTGRQFNLGLAVSLWKQRWPVAIAADIMTTTVAKAAGARWEGHSTTDLHLGVRKIWSTGKSRSVRPYVGGGVAFIKASLQERVYPSPAGERRSGEGTGYWFGGGVSWRLREHLNLGIDGRFSRASVSLPLGSGDALVNFNAGGAQLNAIVGYGW